MPSKGRCLLGKFTAAGVVSEEACHQGRQVQPGDSVLTDDGTETHKKALRVHGGRRGGELAVWDDEWRTRATGRGDHWQPALVTFKTPTVFAASASARLDRCIHSP